MAVRPFFPHSPFISYTFSPITKNNRSFRRLAPRTRMLLGVGIMVYAGLGMAMSDRFEEKIGMKPTEEDRDKLEKEMERWTVRVRRA